MKCVMLYWTIFLSKCAFNLVSVFSEQTYDYDTTMCKLLCCYHNVVGRYAEKLRLRKVYLIFIHIMHKHMQKRTCLVIYANIIKRKYLNFCLFWINSKTYGLIFKILSLIECCFSLSNIGKLDFRNFN